MIKLKLLVFCQKILRVYPTSKSEKKPYMIKTTLTNIKCTLPPLSVSLFSSLPPFAHIHSAHRMHVHIHTQGYSLHKKISILTIKLKYKGMNKYQDIKTI